MTLPILTFDERSLSPRFGYVFDVAWLEPCESILGMLRKFVRANRPVAAPLVEQIGARPSDGYAGLRPCGADVDARAVARLLGIRGAASRPMPLPRSCAQSTRVGARLIADAKVPLE
jgi:hypothetical protein